MDLVKYTAQLDLTDNGCFDTGWRIKQGDYGNSQLMISLVDNGVNAFDANVIPQINFKRPDGKSVLADMTVEQNVYSYIFVGNELEIAGTVLMDVKFVTPQGRTSSSSCKFTCVEDTIGIDTTGASTYYNPVSEAIEEAKALAEEVGGFTGAIEDLRQNKQNKLIAGRNITIDEETNVISASGGGGGGGSSVIANPTLSGGEADLIALEVDGTKYKVSGGGGNADKVELTKAEYDALPDTKLTDGKMYFIKDWNEGGSIPSGIIDVADKFSIYDGRVDKTNFNASKIGDLIILSGYLTVLKSLSSTQTSILIADADVLPIDSFYFSFIHTVNDVHTLKTAQCNSSSRNINFNHNGLSVNDKLYIDVIYKVVK